MDHSNKRSIVDHVLPRALFAAFLAIPAPSFADDRAGGQMTIVDVTLDVAVDEGTDNWGVVMAEAINLTDASNIIVTACSDVANPDATPATYRFVLTLDDTAPGLNTGSERQVEFDDPANDAELVHVCSTRYFNNVGAGNHTIRWLASKADDTHLDTIIEDSSMTLVASDGLRL